ncbi:MAG TPA: FAD-dependent oxidoreductase [bacterium]|nr:FAD-dependent oxidoreductase [bacterium]HQI04517.1 FAD-dependent oxidoreductase [bacterium]
MKVLIVGGVAGGATAAARLRRNDENIEIILFEKGSDISYANCGLPYYIGGTISNRENLFLQTPEGFAGKFNLSVKTNNEVLSIDRTNKVLHVKDIITNQEYSEKYDKLLLSPGAVPVKPQIPGIEGKDIFTLRNVSDTDLIKEKVLNSKPKRAVVVGAGFIGLETAENLHNLGINTTIVEMADQVMAPLDYELAAEVHQHLKMMGVEFYLNDSVTAFEDSANGKIVRLRNGKSIAADMVILSIGVRPLSKLAQDAGLDISEKKGIVVNEWLQTSDPDIYAVGDAVEFINPITGKPALPYLAGPANRQARIVADNIAFGNVRKYLGAIGTGIAKIFDLTAATTGLNEKTLKDTGIKYSSVITHSSSHAGYYPGAVPLTVKTIFERESGRLLGAQIVGFDGVDKRIDLFATILKNRGTIYDLQEIEHAYAPPFSSAKDPVNVAGYAAENILKGKVDVIYWNEFHKNLSKYRVVDVRTTEETALGMIEGSVNIPLDELRNRMKELRKDDSVVVLCAVGLRGYLAARILVQNGFRNVKNLSGGYKTYSLAVQKQSNEDIFNNDYIGKDDMIYSTKPAEQIVYEKKVVKLDACGLQCPGPIMKLKESMDSINPGDRIEIIATDQGFFKDSKSWCNVTGNILVDLTSEKGKIKAVIEKSVPQSFSKHETKESRTGKTIVVFSDDMDRALASFVIANGAASMGRKVTMFFTFWGLNIVKRENPPAVSKDFMGKMFGMMLPSSSKKLKLSKMNMGGIGTKMMRGRMKGLKIDSLETMIDSARKNGVEMIACQMSMDVMGVKEPELMDGVKIGGVATYLEHAEDAGVNLFI